MRADTNNVKRVIWSNGQVDEAETWSELLEVVRRSQVRRVGRRAFRKQLQHRAWVWSGAYVDHMARPRDLFEQLEYAKLLRILPESGILIPKLTSEREEVKD